MKAEKATLFALAAILLWSTLALAGVRSTSLPPFLLLGVAFCTSGLFSIIRPRAWRVQFPVLLVGVGGIFGYHALYFRAFALAPAVEVNLVNYLWPLLIVVLAPLILPQFQLRRNHLFGALLGLTGAMLIVSGGRFNLQSQFLLGYLAALGAAITWAMYSLLTRHLPPFPTDTVAVFCAISGVLALTIHFSTTNAWTLTQAVSLQDWVMMISIGFGPMGAAFYFWDAALKSGDPRRIGSLAYLTPLLSTLNLILFARQSLTWVTGLAMMLIILGAVIGGRSKTFNPQPIHKGLTGRRNQDT
jgi:drug/metabolite transporter (DMT)-like permease